MERFACCLLPVVPLRKEPSDGSEMVSQLLFGEPLRVVEKGEKWIGVASSLDGYEGWVDAKQIRGLSPSQHEELLGWKGMVCDAMSKVRIGSRVMMLPMGSRLPEGRSSLWESVPELVGASAPESLLTTALSLLGSPYLWGGKTLMGIDCSGFVQVVHSVHGIRLPRDAKDQALCGTLVEGLQESVAGDLAFFSNPQGRVIHVGILLPDQEIIHASGEVRIDRIDSRGIFNRDRGLYTHQLCRIVRVR